jgi:uncharacterized protein (TIGR02646 family)
MRRQHREPLPLIVRRELNALQASAHDSPTAQAEWNKFIQRLTGTELKTQLLRMARIRSRCAYCDDSKASDVDHFWPISPYFDKAFDWFNHLWSCSDCNRRKSTQFPLANGLPLLLNPVEEDWWSHLSLDTASGVLAARFATDGSPDEKGLATLRVFRALNHEAVIEGRYRALSALKDSAAAVVADQNRGTISKLGKAIATDDFDVASWFAFGPGQEEAPFSELRILKAEWRRFVSMAARRQYAG